MVAPGLTFRFTPLVTAPTPLSMLPVPPLNVKERVAVPPFAMLAGVAVKLAMLGAGTTVTVVVAVTVPPAALATVRTKLVVVIRVPVLTATPEVTTPMPLSTPPVPPEKTAISVVLVPAVMVGCAAVKLVITGTAKTCTVVCAVTLVPAELVTVSVKIVVADRLPVLTATPEVTVPIPWSTLPVPPEKMAVRVVLVPEVMVGWAAMKLVIPGAARICTVSGAVTLAPAKLVTVTVKVVVADRLPVFTGTPEVTVPIPWSTLPVPPEKMGVRVVLVPAVRLDCAAVKLVIVGAPEMLTVTGTVILVPTALVTVSV